ncbi:MAG: sigma 54-interacting transcriptional regulator [Planctomycetaceae bacterium]
MKYGLILLNGATPGAGLTIGPEQRDITLGRDSARELPLDDNHCSRLHARIWFDSRCWQIEDCGSSNGTFVNSRRIDRALLRPGDVIRVGESLIVFSREHDANEPQWQTRRLASSTFMMRVAEPDQQPEFTEGLLNEVTGLARSAAVLCQLSQQLHRQESRDAIVRLVSDAIVQATHADTVTVWLAGSDGRLTAVGGRNRVDDVLAVPVFASLAIENNEAMLVQNGTTKTDITTLDGTDTHVPGGTDMLITVPIPGRSERYGAIECGRSSNNGALDKDDLNVVIAIAHQTGLALENFDHRERLELANQQLRTAIHGQHRLVGDSPAMRQLFDMIARVAPVDSTVLIRGESGTGKELVARMIHEANARHAGPYVPINCAAFSESLLESELFGHEKGAFTGADQRRVGQFERAHRGTLFLDEIGEMSAACQARLLRILEKHPFERVGGTESIHVDVRVIAATHRDLPELVADGRFREDLFFRLKVIEVPIPPLRDRGDDVFILSEHFLYYFRRQIGHGPQRFSNAALNALRDYPWPGNVRELRNAIERAMVLGRDAEVEVADLGLPATMLADVPDSIMVPLAVAERRHILSVLDHVAGNKTQACKVLGIGRGTLYKKLEEYGM